jgi:hypothetical protein
MKATNNDKWQKEHRLDVSWLKELLTNRQAEKWTTPEKEKTKRQRD